MKTYRTILFIAVWMLCAADPMLFAEDTVDATAEETSVIESTDAEMDVSQFDPMYHFSTGVFGGALFPLKDNQDVLGTAPQFAYYFNWHPKWVKFFMVRGEIDYAISSVTGAEVNNTTHLLGFGVFPLFSKRIIKGLSFYAGAGGGAKIGMVRVGAPHNVSTNIANLYGKALLGLEFNLMRAPLSFKLEGSFSLLADSEQPLMHAGIHAGVGYYFMDPKVKAMLERRIEVIDMKFYKVFGALYTKYTKMPVGKVELKNAANHPLTDIKAEFFVQRYMDNPKASQVVETLGPNETATIDLNALFNQEVLGITEDTVLSAQVRITYKDNEEEKEFLVSDDLNMFNRNAMTWSDTKKLGSFITLNDESVRAFARSLVTQFKNGETPLLDKIEEAAQIFTGLKLYGLQYVTDPNTPFSEFSGDMEVVDRINYPRETLMYKSGDCDDLVVLYCSLLENVGIQTAFVTVPGHIFMMFNTGLPEAELEKVAEDPRHVHIHEGEIWIPVEVTTVHKEPFSTAWEFGADQLKRWRGTDGLEVIPTTAAQQEYPAVSLLPVDFRAELPEAEALAAAVAEDQEVLMEIAAIQTTEDLEQEFANDPDNMELCIRLALLYLEEANLDKAVEYLLKALELEPNDYDARFHLGTAYIQQEEYGKAEELLNSCMMDRPGDTNVYLAMSVIYEEQTAVPASTGFESPSLVAMDDSGQMGRAAEIAGVNLDLIGAAVNSDRSEQHRLFVARLDQLFNNGYYEIVLKLVDAYFEENRTVPELVILKGMAQFGLEDYETALATFESAPFVEEYAELMDYFVIRCYFELGDEAQTLRKFMSFERNYPDSSLIAELNEILGM